MRAAIRRAAEVMKKDWKELLPPNGAPGSGGTGELKSTLQVKTYWFDDTQEIVAIVGTRRGPGGGNHIHLVELGHKIVSHGKTTGARTYAPKPTYRDLADSMTESTRELMLIQAAGEEVRKLGDGI